jgi:hypothetical protein
MGRHDVGDADWRAHKMQKAREVILGADPEIVEERKWFKASNPDGIPVWSCAGNICTGETYKKVIKLTFFKGAALSDPKGLFNSSLEGNTRRAIDIAEDEDIDEAALEALVREAVALNRS